MKIIDKEITFLGLSSKLEDKLRDNNISVIRDLWLLKRCDLKEIALTDQEINEISIKLQLQGLDLNKKSYGK